MTAAPAPCAPALTARLTAAIADWSTSQHRVVELAAAFADSGEWAAAGFPSAAHWIAAAADIEVSTAREWIRVGRVIRSLPLIADAFANRELSYSKVRALTRFATPANEAALLAIAEAVPAGQLNCALAAWIGRHVNPEELERYHQQQRSVSWRAEPDGMVSLSARLPPLVGGLLIAALTTAVMTARTRTRTADRPTLAQQYADALEQLLREGSGVVTEIVLHVRGDGCTLDDGTPIPQSVVEKVAPDALIRVLVHDALGRPTNVSHRRRHPTTGQKRIVKERDRVCVDCGSTELLQYDHHPDFAVTGHTVIDELELRCAPCHRRRHEAA